MAPAEQDIRPLADQREQKAHLGCPHILRLVHDHGVGGLRQHDPPGCDEMVQAAYPVESALAFGGRERRAIVPQYLPDRLALSPREASAFAFHLESVVFRQRL